MVQKLMWEMFLKTSKNMDGWMDGDLLISQKYQICIWMGPKMGGADTLDICCLQYTQNT